jgi:hypothetical protein
MILGVIAIVIAVLSAGFTGWMAIMNYNEQKVRLRPQVYIDRIDTNIKSDTIFFKSHIKNCGLLPANNVTISLSLSLGDRKQKTNIAEPGATESVAVILPNQVFYNTMYIKKPAWDDVLSGKKALTAETKIDYRSGKKEYSYYIESKFNPESLRWTIVKGKVI